MRSYPLPAEIKNTLLRDLKLRPLIRYVNNVKALNSIPPSYRIFLHNGQSFALYIEETSIVAKIGDKSYWLSNMEETNEAIRALNRVLTQPIPSSGGEDEGEAAGDEGGAEDAGGSSDTEMEPEELEDEETTA